MSDIEQMYNESTAMSVDVPKLLRNTYSLLACTVLFSAVMAFVGMQMNIGFISPFMTLAIVFGLFFGIAKTANSGMGIVLTFALTGYLGFSLAPLITAYMGAGKGNIVVQAFAGTAFIFFGLSAYALTTKKDFTFLSGFLMTGGLVLMAAVVMSIFLQIPALHIAISCGFMVFSSASILFYTSSAIKGGETNYVMLTVGLFMAAYNLFVSLLSILGIFGGDD
ncbi:Bax inhibitor-1/YccA family protein [Marinicellulosiphila megalodicopiae]|uniref:Bax inhibitor-1/YccA family protein n=1 Tax=Marinicellulosiphila megalodicopiae TaxID=2724896 RepID=UPI003BB1D6C1